MTNTLQAMSKLRPDAPREGGRYGGKTKGNHVEERVKDSNELDRDSDSDSRDRKGDRGRERDQGRREKSQNKKTSKREHSKQKSDDVCTACGRDGHSAEDCKIIKSHPNANRSSLPWSETEQGKAFAQIPDTKKGGFYETLPWGRDLKGNRVEHPKEAHSNSSTERKEAKRQRR